MKRILITTDFSSQSKQAIRFVIDFLQNMQMPVHILLLNTYMVDEFDANKIILLHDELKKKSKEGLKKELMDAQKSLMNPQITLETRGHIGSLKNVIQQLLKMEKIDFVAIGQDEEIQVEDICAILQQHEFPQLIYPCRK